jgi:hypothetical protein
MGMEAWAFLPTSSDREGNVKARSPEPKNIVAAL